MTQAAKKRKRKIAAWGRAPCAGAGQQPRRQDAVGRIPAPKWNCGRRQPRSGLKPATRPCRRGVAGRLG